MIAPLALLSLASVAAAHIDIVYPQGSWTHTEDQQDTGAVCGGGTRVSSFAWGTENSFVAVAGDAGELVTIRLASSNSTTAMIEPTNAASFPSILAQRVPMPASGVLCIPVSLPNSVVGSRALLYVEAAEANSDDNDDTVSTCAEVVLVPADVTDTIVTDHGQSVINPATNAPITFFDFYCSNTTILALDDCDCHCDGTVGHCSSSCSAERVAASNALCLDPSSAPAVSSSACDCHCDGTEGHCSGTCTDGEEAAYGVASCGASAGPSATTSALVATGTVGSAGAAENTGTSGASSLSAVGGVAMLAAAFSVVFQ